MKKKFFMLTLAVCVFVLLACAVIPASANKADVKADVLQDKALSARFLNMLNRNFVYNSDFESADIITENSILAILDRRDGEDSDYISEAVVKGFVKDMYGIEIIDINENESVHKDGYVYIVPRGFTSYRHTIDSILANEDGSFTVYSTVTVSPHDDEQFSASAETLFVKNETSAFGYNIIYSNLSGVASGI